MSEPAWLVAARKDLGLKEIVGSKHEPRVVKFFAESGNAWVKDDETAWCAAFVGAKLAEAGLKGTGKLNARSYLDWGTPLKTPVPGCIVVFKRGSSTWQGHVAFFLRDLGSQIEVLGGNQSNSVSIARYVKLNLLGFLWPTGVPLPSATKVIAPAQRPRLQLGSRSDVVATWQTGLNDLGAAPKLVVDKDFGPKTRDATLAFQKRRLLAPDGSVEEPDWTMLDTLLEALG
ncbi:TIGR02594 family protein [Methylopila sp. M107]|uniref:C40 family peptidase n=1 Tax=Methylopila sp. M107 TaxID=1101190 RepID=UPI0003825756|nr:TIGR02594 family protein [Methylopila sp. M107]